MTINPGRSPPLSGGSRRRTKPQTSLLAFWSPLRRSRSSDRPS